MEILEFSGYIEDEKLKIAKRHLIPKQIEENGLTKKEVGFDDTSIKELIRSYTREAGVRNLEREIANVLRKVARDQVENKSKKTKLTKKKVLAYLGAPRFYSELAERTTKPGVVTGLAWTAAGGDILFIEASKMKGKGILTLTGHLGDVMKESAQAALSYVRTNANQLGIFSSVFEKTDIHIHVPAGAVPKDGPSAGVTIATSLISAFTSIPVRKDVAMTGEITLRGKVLAIGGLKEKLLASKRGLISTVMIPHNNKKNLSEIPDEIQKGLKIIPVQTVEEVLEIALEHLPTPVIDAEGDDAEKTETESPEVTILPQTESPESPRTYDA